MENALRAECASLANPDAAPPPVFNLMTPRSACPKCKAPITALQNIPVVSWIALGRKCANCKTPISARYPLVELFSGIASGVIAWRFGFGVLALAALFFTWSLIALTMIDFDTQFLPDELTYPLLWIGLLVSTTHPVWAEGAAPLTPADSIVGAMCGYLSLWTVYWIFKLITKKEGMGYGDFKLFAAFGAWFGWRMLLPIILIASLVGSVAGIYIIYRQRKGMNTPIAFGPFLAAAGWLFLLVGHQTVDRYLALYAQPH
jgi:leader peptidase (prepilin peptidase)/N-methyltransferase